MPQNGINHKGITALAEAFQHNPKLKHLNLSDNTFTEIGSLSMSQVSQGTVNPRTDRASMLGYNCI